MLSSIWTLDATNMQNVQKYASESKNKSCSKWSEENQNKSTMSPWHTCRASRPKWDDIGEVKVFCWIFAEFSRFIQNEKQCARECENETCQEWSEEAQDKCKKSLRITSKFSSTFRTISCLIKAPLSYNRSDFRKISEIARIASCGPTIFLWGSFDRFLTKLFEYN